MSTLCSVCGTHQDTDKQNFTDGHWLLCDVVCADCMKWFWRCYENWIGPEAWEAMQQVARTYSEKSRGGWWP